MELIKEIIRKEVNEILDYNEKFVDKKAKSETFIEPISSYKRVKINDTVINISFLIDEYDNSLEVSFSDENNSFESLTNNNVIGRIFSNITYYTIQFLKEIDKKIKIGDSFNIEKLVFTPSKIKNYEAKVKADQTKRGRLYIFFTKKMIDIKNIKSDNYNVELFLKNKIKIGGGNFKNLNLKN